MSRNIVKLSETASAENLVRRNVVKSRVLEAREEAAQIIAAAEARAAEITSKAERRAQKLREQAYREGKEKAAAEFAETIAAAHEKRERVLTEIESDVLKLSIKIAEKIIGREIETDKKTVADIVSVALRHVRQQDRLIVRVNPNDLPIVKEFQNRLHLTGRASFIDFEPDPKVATKGCIIESEVGTVDARLETQLRILENALLSQAGNEA